jgi:hypothetical protein
MRHFLTALALTVLLPVASAAGPTCALLDPEKSPRAALLEAKLLSEPGATWVERASIDKVLAEQKLQAAFGPQGVSERVKLGKLLKADLLVMVRPVKDAKEPVLEVVVSETATGLRLLLRAVPLTKNTDADVAALVAAAKDGIRKHSEKITEVVAVPPFVSNDLGYQFEHLKGAFAKLAESVALDRRGVVVVELAEAEALAKEIALAAPGAKVERPSPLYLVGEYRHEGRDAERTVTLKLRTERAGKPVGKPETLAVKTDAAPEALRKWAASVLDATGGAVALPDPKAEVKRLGELIAIHQRLGNWKEAMALIEASLLLDPKQPELNADAMLLLRNEIQRVLDRFPKELARLRVAAPLHCRGVEHMESLVTSRAKLPRYEGLEAVRGGRAFFSTFPLPRRPSPYDFETPPADPPEVQEIIREVDRQHRACLVRLLPGVMKEGTEGEVAWLVRGSLGYAASGAERFAEYRRFLLEHQDNATVVKAADPLLFISAHEVWLSELPEYRKLLDALEKDGNAGLKAAAERARKRLPEIEKQMIRLTAEAAERKRLADLAKKNPPVPPTTPGRPTREEQLKALDEQVKGTSFRRITLKGASPEDEWLINRSPGVIPVGPGIDVFWGTGYYEPARPGENPKRPKPTLGTGTHAPTLLVMKQKGELKRVWEKIGAPERFSSVCFDGKYVWFATEGMRMAPALFGFDPQTETVFEVTEKDGLPQPTEDVVKDRRRFTNLSLVVTPIEPGRACVAGGFGRGWIGVASFDAATKKATVKVIHEAREVPRQGEKYEVFCKNRDIAFDPGYAFTLPGKPGADGKTPVRVILGRRVPHGVPITNDHWAMIPGYPLVIDPDAGTVEVITASCFGLSGEHVAVGEAALYVPHTPANRPQTVRLARVEYPGVVHDLGELPNPKVNGPFPATLAGGRVYFAADAPPPVYTPGTLPYHDSSWWVVDADGKNATRLVEKLPHIRMLARSSHYGLIAWCDIYSGFALCEVTLPDGPKK